jgi:hypothetical protein
MTVFTWEITKLDRYTADGIVFAAHYTLDAADGVHTAGAYGSIGLEAPAKDDTIIPYADLTPELVLGWVQEQMGAESIGKVEAALQTRLDEQATKASGVPWQ